MKRVHIQRYGAILLAGLLWSVQVCAQRADFFDLMMQRILDDRQSKMTDAIRTKAKEYAAMQDVDGSWKDIAYTETAITKWSAGRHFDRLLPMVMVYVEKGNSLYGDADLKTAIDKALTFWIQHDYKSDNWWHNEIAVPKAIGTTLIMLHFGKEPVSTDVRAAFIKRMERGDPYAKTGANKSDIAMHYFYRALLTRDETLLTNSLEQLFYPVQLVDGKEGLQYDYSYLQHGPQLYIAGYGEEFLKGISTIMFYVRETPYAMPADKLAIFSRFLKDTYLPIVRYGYIDFNVHGRGVSRPGILQKSDMLEVVSRMRMLDPDHGTIWQDAQQELAGDTNFDQVFSPVHKHFWKGDYTIHLRDNYHVNVRLASNRTYKSEAGNQENVLGKNMTDGVTNIQVFGDEYYNIMPVWEWDKIPGTTTRDYAEDQFLVEQWGKPAQNRFAGGVSDGRYGASAMQVDYDGVQANKAWFFFDDQVVCLGSGITSAADEPLVTTVNQTWLKGVVHHQDNVLQAGTEHRFSVKPNDWLRHRDVVYVFSEEADVSLSLQEEQGSWSQINRPRSAETAQGDVFKLWLNHGVKPQDARYAYIIYPGWAEDSPVHPEAVRVLENTDKVQAVSHIELGIAQAVFYEPTSFTAGDVKVEVDQPCLLQWKITGDHVEVFLADPLQTATQVTVSITLTRDARKAICPIDLPQGAACGSTVQAKLRLVAF